MTFLRQGQAACAMNMPATDGSDENAQLPGHREPDCIGIWVMKTLKTGIMLALAGGAMVAATAAEAQDWRYDDYMAHRAGRGAEIHAYQAGRDQRAADTAAYYGDYRAADAYAHAAAVRRAEARRDARFARHERHAARWDYWHGGGWGY